MRETSMFVDKCTHPWMKDGLPTRQAVYDPTYGHDPILPGGGAVVVCCLLCGHVEA